jgi:hypothetical protein
MLQTDEHIVAARPHRLKEAKPLQEQAQKTSSSASKFSGCLMTS